MSGWDPVAYAPMGDPGAGTLAANTVFFDIRQTFLSQFANSPALTTLLTQLGAAIDLQSTLDQFRQWCWDIASAQGFGLDIIGRKVGVTRALYVAASASFGFNQQAEAEGYDNGSFWAGWDATANYKLADSAFQRLILAKAALNITNCSIPAINAILMTLFPDYGNSYVQDNGDMTMTYVFGSQPSVVDLAIVEQSGALPKPVGVSFTVSY